jgi:hypothetical protein
MGVFMNVAIKMAIGIWRLKYGDKINDDTIWRKE